VPQRTPGPIRRNRRACSSLFPGEGEGRTGEGYNVTTWHVIFAPVRTPKEIVARLQGEIDKALKSAELQERLKGVGVTIVNGHSSEAAVFVKSEYEKWANVIRQSGAKLN
jgi:tripartite-type tricarboxylate transporter receptor subunit TctC